MSHLSAIRRVVLLGLLRGNLLAGAVAIAGSGVGNSLAGETAKGGAELPLQPFEKLTRQFLGAISSQDYDRAFAMLSQTDIKVAARLKGGDPQSLLAAKKRSFLEQSIAQTAAISEALASSARYNSVRHDDGNVTVWLPTEQGRIAVQFTQYLDGRMAIRSFSVGDAPISN